MQLLWIKRNYSSILQNKRAEGMHNLEYWFDGTTKKVYQRDKYQIFSITFLEMEKIK